MSKKLGIIMDPIQSINFKKDTSLLILLAAKKSGFTLYLIEQHDLYPVSYTHLTLPTNREV